MQSITSPDLLTSEPLANSRSVTQGSLRNSKRTNTKQGPVQSVIEKEHQYHPQLHLEVSPPLSLSTLATTDPLPSQQHDIPLFPRNPEPTTTMSSSLPWDYIAKLVCIGDSGCGKSSLTIRLCEGRFVTHHDVTIGVEFGSRIVPVGPPHSDSQEQQQPASLPSFTDSTDPATSIPNGTSSSGLPPPPIAAKLSTSTSEPPPPQKHMKLSLWDTAGQETYKSVTRSYFRGASGALLVFDLSRKQTFEHVTDWLNDLRAIAEPDIVVILVGNKADLTEQNEEGDGQNKREITRKEAEEWARKNGVLEYVETSAKSGENVEKAFMRVAERIYQNIQAGKYDLNDRRSGVKGPSAGLGGGGTGGGTNVKLTGDKAGGYGGCC